MIFPTFFSRYKKYRVYDEQGRFIAIYSYQKQGSYSESKKCFSILMENRKIRFKLCK